MFSLGFQQEPPLIILRVNLFSALGQSEADLPGAVCVAGGLQAPTDGSVCLNQREGGREGGEM